MPITRHQFERAFYTRTWSSWADCGMDDSDFARFTDGLDDVDEAVSSVIRKYNLLDNDEPPHDLDTRFPPQAGDKPVAKPTWRARPARGGIPGPRIE